MTQNQVKTIAKNIRKHKKVSFKEIALKAGVPYSTFENIIFAQIKDVQISTLSKIAKALSISVDDLLK